MNHKSKQVGGLVQAFLDNEFTCVYNNLGFDVSPNSLFSERGETQSFSQMEIVIMKTNIFASLLVVALLFAGCSKDDNPATPPSGNTSVSGIIQSFGGQPVAGAFIRAFSGNTNTGTPVATDTSDSAGQWQSVVSSGGKYTWMVTAAGLPTSIFTVNVPAGRPTLGLGNTILAEQTINGIINDAQTGQPVQNAVIRFFSGTGSDTSGYRFPELTTNAQGSWTNTFTMGSYVGAIYAANHVPLVTGLSVTDTTTGQLTTTITQPVPAGQMRIVLNWGFTAT